MKSLPCFLIIVVYFYGCVPKEKINEYILVSTNEKIEFNIPNDVSSITDCLQYYLTKNDKQFLCYLSRNNNKLLFFNIDSLTLSFTIQMPVIGPEGVGKIKGFLVHNMDTILLTTREQRTLYIIDQYVNLKEKIPVSRDIKNGEYGTYIRNSIYFEKNLILDGHNIYAGTHLLKHPGPKDLQDYKLCLQIDLINSQQKLLPMAYPPLGNKNNEAVYNYFSTILVENEFIYSFMSSHNLYKTKDHNIIKTKPAKSRYIKKDFELPDFSSGSFEIIGKTVLEHPSYRNFYYDKYRNVFYRFVYPGIKIDKSDNISDMLEYRPVFSIMILDSNLNIISEQLMPYKTYNMNMAFVAKEGLYISTNHPRNPDFSADYLRFELFKLKKKRD